MISFKVKTANRQERLNLELKLEKAIKDCSAYTHTGEVMLIDDTSDNVSLYFVVGRMNKDDAEYEISLSDMVDLSEAATRKDEMTKELEKLKVENTLLKDKLQRINKLVDSFEKDLV